MDLPPFIQAALSMAETMSPALFTSLRGALGSPGRGLASQIARADHWPAVAVRLRDTLQRWGAKSECPVTAGSPLPHSQR
jgi:hypothetical protein